MGSPVGCRSWDFLARGHGSQLFIITHLFLSLFTFYWPCLWRPLTDTNALIFESIFISAYASIFFSLHFISDRVDIMCYQGLFLTAWIPSEEGASALHSLWFGRETQSSPHPVCTITWSFIKDMCCPQMK